MSSVNLFGIPESSLGALVAAFITATLTFLGLVVSKEQKTSDFRQAWIDEVRKDVASLVASLHFIDDAERLNNGFDKDSWLVARDQLIVANQALLRVRLRLNETEEDSKKLLTLLSEAENILTGSDFAARKMGLLALEGKIVEVAKVVLKLEWERVKRGEVVFQTSKWAALALLLISMLALIKSIL